MEIATGSSTGSAALVEAVRGALSVVDDPELGVDIVSLGLVYGIEEREGRVRIRFTLTSMGCPIGPMIEHDVVTAAERVPGVSAVETELVFEPPWSPDLMNDEVKFVLGYLT
jgi:metal-sulfur cluster biosynthetic enzyme